MTPPGWFDANCASALSLTHSMLRRVNDPPIPDRFLLKRWMDRELAKGGGTPKPWIEPFGDWVWQ